MKPQMSIKILVGLLLLVNINVSAYKPINVFAIIDSLVQVQDSSLQKVWEINNGSFSSTKLLVSPNFIYSTSDSGLVTCYNYDGSEKWAAEVLGMITNNSALYKDLLLTSTQEGDLYSINSNNGEILQVVGIGENITTDLSLIEITNDNSKSIGVILGTSEGNIFCYDAFTFELLWQKNISSSKLISTPIVEKDKLVFLNGDFSLYCVNAKSGSLIWKYEFSDDQNNSAINFPVSNGKNIFSLSPDGKLFAIDLLLGKKSWSSNTKEMLNQIYVTSDKQKLFLFDNKGFMAVYSAKDGKEISKADFKKSDLFAFTIAENQENTFIGSSDGSLFTFDSKFVTRELLSPNQIPITSINVINEYEFIVKDKNGIITFYKIN
ncbi:MAG TPA: PQQ-binding-like beta-propeller repeat protein [Ignavibacteriaceae bacterium]